MTEFVWWWYRVFYSRTLLSRQNLLYHEILLVQGLTFARALLARRVNKWPLFLVGRGAAGPDESREERWGSKQIQHKCFPRQGEGPQNFRSQGQSGSERARALTWAGVSRPQVRLVGACRMVTTWGLRRQTGLTDSRLCCSRQTNASISLSLHLSICARGLPAMVFVRLWDDAHKARSTGGTCWYPMHQARPAQAGLHTPAPAPPRPLPVTRAPSMSSILPHSSVLIHWVSHVTGSRKAAAPAHAFLCDALTRTTGAGREEVTHRSRYWSKALLASTSSFLSRAEGMAPSSKGGSYLLLHGDLEGRKEKEITPVTAGDTACEL